MNPSLLKPSISAKCDICVANVTTQPKPSTYSWISNMNQMTENRVQRTDRCMPQCGMTLDMRGIAAAKLLSSVFCALSSDAGGAL